MAYARGVQPVPASGGFSVVVVLRICADARRVVVRASIAIQIPCGGLSHRLDGVWHFVALRLDARAKRKNQQHSCEASDQRVGFAILRTTVPKVKSRPGQLKSYNGPSKGTCRPRGGDQKDPSSAWATTPNAISIGSMRLGLGRSLGDFAVKA